VIEWVLLSCGVLQVKYDDDCNDDDDDDDDNDNDDDI
jgi:hypothetical protein